MALQEAIVDIWSSDYVQKNPTKAYKVTYDDEYAAVAAYLNGGPEPNFANFSKLGRGLCGAEKERRGGVVTPPPDPTPGEFLWDAPVLSNPSTRTLTKASPNVAVGIKQDLKIVFGEELDRNVGQIEGYNDVLMEDFVIRGGTPSSSGTIIPRENTGTFFMKNGRVQLTVAADAIVSRWRTPRIYHVNMWVEVTKAGTTFHSDGFQTQEAIVDELGWDRCTIKSDYQGIFQSNEVQNAGPARSKVDKTIISRVLFLPGTQGFPATFFFKAFPPRPGADPIGLTEMYNVFMPINPVHNQPSVYPNAHSWTGWDGSPMKHGAFMETRMHPQLNRTMRFCRFSTTSDRVPAGMPLAGQQCADCGVRGDGGIWVYDSLTPDILALAGSVGV